MLENIKSKNIIQLLFSYLDDNLKLKILIYNKKLQSKIKINLMNYKRFSNKYIIYEDNKLKEYDIYTNNLMFEGEYLNKEKYGKGKEYFLNGKLLFEGEYLNGKRWNGKGYDEDNNIIYELKNGKGHVIEFNKNENLIFEGEYINGQKNGKGKEYSYPSKELIFDGEYLNGKKNGKGREFLKNFLIFEGEYLNDKKWNGKINNENNDNIIYELKNGKGFLIDVIENNSIYEGEFLNGLKNGKGKEYQYFLKFEGEYLYGHKLKGKEYVRGNLEFIGEYLYDKKWNGKGYDKNGKVIYELNNGNGKIKEYDYTFGYIKFEGEYINGERNGKGKEYNIDHCLIFEGEYLNGKRLRGKQYNKKNILIFEGEYLNGKKWNGKGKEYNRENILLFEGEYLNGKKWNGNLYNGVNNTIYKLNQGKAIVKQFIYYRELFEGEYLNGERYKGKVSEYGALIFEGQFLNEKKWNGKGKEYHMLGQIKFEGEYKNGKKNGQGKEFFEDEKIKFIGEYLNDNKWNGKGYDKKGKVIYEINNGNGIIKELDDIYGWLRFEGEYINGEKNGKGKDYYYKYDRQGKLSFEGKYLKGKRYGIGKDYGERDNLIFEGEYINDEKLIKKFKILHVDNILKFEK